MYMGPASGIGIGIGIGTGPSIGAVVLVCCLKDLHAHEPLDCVVFYAILMCNDVDARADNVERPHFR